MKALKAILSAFVLLSGSAHASLVTLESRWCCGGSSAIPGTLTFTYDDSIIDSVDDEGIVIDNSHPQVGLYQNAIVSASYVVTSGVNIGKTFIMPGGSSSSITIRKFPGVFGPASLRISLSLNDGTTDFSTLMQVEGHPPLTDDLSGLPFTTVADETFLAVGGILLSPQLYAGNRLFNDVSSVPVPASAWLFSSGLFGLIGLARKRKFT